MSILNLTQHAASSTQVEAGVIEPADKAAVQALISFTGSVPTKAEMIGRAEALVGICHTHGVTQAMIGGAPFFQSTLEAELLKAGITPLHAFSERVSVDTINPDGTVSKTAQFRHLGFYTVP